MCEKINLIKGYRVMVGYTQEQMAEVIGVKRRQYLDKENGKTKFSINELAAIRDLLVSKGVNVMLDDLV